MDWTTTEFDWNQTRAFLVTAKEGSFSAAAVAMKLTQPTVSRQVAALEDTLQVVLFEKSGRGLVLTPIGQELLEHAHRMEEAAAAFSLTANGNSSSLKGNVCVSAPEIIAGHVLPALIHKLHHEYPDIRVEILAANEVSDLRRREADIAIRSFRPTQLDLITKKLGIQCWGLYASTEFIAAQGSLENVPALENASYIAFDQSNTLITHLAKQDLNITQSNIAVVAQNMLVALELIKLGTGIGVLPVEVGEQQPGICRVAKSLVQFEVENWLVSHSELRTNIRVRVVFDFLNKALGD